MKKLGLLLTMFCCFNICNTEAQKNPNSVTFIHSILSGLADVYEKGGVDVIRTETGFLLPDGDNLEAYTFRRFVANKKYIASAYVDDRIKDIKLVIYKRNTEGKWDKVKERDDEHSDAKDEGIGGYESIGIETTNEAEYAIGIIAEKKGNRAGRYGLTVGVTDITTKESDGQKKLFFSTERRKTCEYDKGQKKFKENCPEENQVTLFELNADKTIFKHTTSSISSSYFVQKYEYDEKNTIHTYTVKSDAGNSYEFMIRNEGSDNMKFYILSNSENPYLITWYLKRVWKE